MVILKAVDQAIISHFGGVGYERYDSVLGVAVDSLEYFWRKLLTKFLALTVDVFVGAAREVDMLE